MAARKVATVARNNIGDCYSDGVYFLEQAFKVAGDPAKAKSHIQRARREVMGVAGYDWADSKDKATMRKCLSDIDKAASNPTEDTIKAARWTCEQARAKADGGSPQTAFWNARRVARNSVEVEVSLMYAGRVQYAMRDAARLVSGVRITGSNTLYCPNDDAADEVVDILEQAGVPKREISLNAKRVARNAGAYDVAAQAGNLFKDAYNALAGCAANLERLTTLGQPNDVPGNDNKIASWAKDKARKVRDIMNKLDQGRL